MKYLANNKLFINDLLNISVVDSIGSFPPSGFAEGVFSDFGEYEECLSIESPDIKRFPTVKGKYCLARLILPFPVSNGEGVPNLTEVSSIIDMMGMSELNQITIDDLVNLLNVFNGITFNLGICIPSICDPEEVQDMLNKSETIILLNNLKTISYKFITVFHPMIRMPIEFAPRCHTIDDQIILNNYQKFSM